MAYIVKVEDAKFSVVEGVKKACRESYDDIDKYVDLVIDIMGGIYADQYEEPKPNVGWWHKMQGSSTADPRWQCSECGAFQSLGPTKYCPACGAKMGPEPLTTGSVLNLTGPWDIKAEDIT